MVGGEDSHLRSSAYEFAKYQNRHVLTCPVNTVRIDGYLLIQLFTKLPASCIQRQACPCKMQFYNPNDFYVISNMIR